jgi:predicted Zn-dependent peptidase
VLGDGTTSRLFQLLREEMGVCYYVRSIEDAHRDYGFLAIRTGVDRRRLHEVIERIIKECQKLKEVLVSDEELERAKEYLLGHMYMGLETTDSQVDFFAFQEAIKHEMKNPEEVDKEIRKVTAEDIRKVAQDIFKSEKLNLAIVGHVHDEDEIKKLLHI